MTPNDGTPVSLASKLCLLSTWIAIAAGVAVSVVAASQDWTLLPRSGDASRCIDESVYSISPFAGLFAARLRGSAVSALSLPYATLSAEDATFDAYAPACSTFPAYLLILGASSALFAVQAAFTSYAFFGSHVKRRQHGAGSVSLAAGVSSVVVSAMLAGSDFNGGGERVYGVVSYDMRVASYPYGAVFLVAVVCAGAAVELCVRCRVLATASTAVLASVAVHALLLVVVCAHLAVWRNVVYTATLPAALSLVALLCKSVSMQDIEQRKSIAACGGLLFKASVTSMAWYSMLYHSERGHGGAAAVTALIFSGLASLLGAVVAGLCLREAALHRRSLHVARVSYFVVSIAGSLLSVAVMDGVAGAMFAAGAATAVMTSLCAVHPAAPPAALSAPLPILLYIAYLVGEDSDLLGQGASYASLALAGYLVGNLFEVVTAAAVGCYAFDAEKAETEMGIVPTEGEEEAAEPACATHRDEWFDKSIVAAPVACLLAVVVLLTQTSSALAKPESGAIGVVIFEGMKGVVDTAPLGPLFGHPESYKRWLLGLALSPVHVSGAVRLVRGFHTKWWHALLSVAWLVGCATALGLGAGPEGLAALCCGVACISGYAAASTLTRTPAEGDLVDTSLLGLIAIFTASLALMLQPAVTHLCANHRSHCFGSGI